MQSVHLASGEIDMVAWVLEANDMILTDTLNHLLHDVLPAARDYDRAEHELSGIRP